jgi:hypothetical protein
MGMATASNASKNSGNRKLIFLVQCISLSAKAALFNGNKNKKTGLIIGKSRVLFVQTVLIKMLI